MFDLNKEAISREKKNKRLALVTELNNKSDNYYRLLTRMFYAIPGEEQDDRSKQEG